MMRKYYLAMTVFWLPAVVSAAGFCENGVFPNPLGCGVTLTEFLSRIISAAVLIMTPIIVLAVMYSGFLFVKAQGKPEELVKARTTLMYTLIGALVLLGAQAIAVAIQNTVNDITNSASIEDPIKADHYLARAI